MDILVKDGQPLRTLAALDRALYNDPGSFHFSSLKAAIYARMGRYAEAILVLNQLSETKDSKNPFFHIQRAEYYRMLGKTRLANADYRKALATSKIWWHDAELMPIVRAYAHKQLGQIPLYRKNLRIVESYGLDKDLLKDNIYTRYSGLNPEW